MNYKLIEVKIYSASTINDQNVIYDEDYAVLASSFLYPMIVHVLTGCLKSIHLKHGIFI